MRNKIFLVTFCLLASFPLAAHTINYALQDAPVSEVAWYYFQLGFQHIIPEGLDHVLFIMGLCLIHTSQTYNCTGYAFTHAPLHWPQNEGLIVAPASCHRTQH